ncbi:MFS transporter [Ktedonosporobacter rubrisoli]|uniref:MFS transporter n=1 Tax=Ktedonosporobacter rubrisoli TaxID=2509675 RepID=A0A4V0YZI8_KTERU|nr:MFS transporter [Ktedonosporobacter rubrisoli]QBD79871.1 MFS transporter [Ktedonosporobacter rubrisoli]
MTPPHSTGQGPRLSKRAMIFLVMTSLLDAMGFGIAGPVLPFAVQKEVPDPATLALLIGGLSSLYAVCQFLAAPALGLLSDRYGRRPLLLLCLLGSALGYLLFGLGGAVWIFILSRLIDGITGGNDSILAAYIGDLSERQTRAVNFGLLSASSGIGLLLGPIVGGFTATLGYQVPFFLAAGLTLLNLLWGFFFLPESLPAQQRAARLDFQALNPLQHLRSVLSLKTVRWLLLCVFLYQLPFAAFGALFAVFIKESLGWNPAQISLILVMVGLTDIVVQGLLIKPLLAWLGEVRMMLVGLGCVFLGYLLFGALALLPSLVLVLLGTFLFAGGGGLVEPPLRSLLAEAAGSEQQGLVQGGSQSIQALAEIGGASAGGVLYARGGYTSLFGISAGIIVLLLLLMWRILTPGKGHPTGRDSESPTSGA